MDPVRYPVRQTIEDGPHWLSGIQEFRIDAGEHGNPGWGDLDGYAFVIDGRRYLAVEDHADGYRSYAWLYSTEEVTASVDVRNQFEPQLVYADNFSEFLEEDCFTTRDVNGLRLKNQYGQTVLEVSTDMSDGYYPVGCVRYHPENLPCNARPLPN